MIELLSRSNVSASKTSGQGSSICKNVQSNLTYPLTVQKSGTHLLKKILDLFAINWVKERQNIHLGGIYKELINGKPYSKLIKKNRKYFVLYRDPRDCVVSQIFYKMKPAQSHSVKNWKQLTKYSIDQLISKSLRFEKVREGRIGSYAEPLFNSLKLALKIKKTANPNQMILRFEDLIPEFAGGPPDEVRFKVFRSICHHAGVEASDEKVKEVMLKCWGGTKTFRDSGEKKVGQWKKYFTDENVKLFHRKYNYLLLGLGYETNPNWHLNYLIKSKE